MENTKHLLMADIFFSLEVVYTLTEAWAQTASKGWLSDQSDDSVRSATQPNTA